MIAAVAGASPVTITVRTPKAYNSLTSSAASVRGGSLSAMNPASRIGVGGAHGNGQNPEALLFEFAGPSRRLLAMASVSLMTTANAPFTTRTVPPFASAAVASDIFVAGSNGTNLVSLGRSVSFDLAAAARIAVSTGSCPPSELARAAIASKCASSKPGSGWTAVTANSLRVNVPVLSEQRTSSVAASSTADNRVGSTPRRANALAPIAAASVNVAGSATGIDARTAVRTRGIISPTGILQDVRVRHQQDDDDAIEHGKISHHAHDCFLLRTLDMGGADEFRGVSKLRVRSSCGDGRRGFAAPHQRSCISLQARSSFDRDGFAGEHRLIE